jgi:aspartyl-tRNA synthetase
MMRIRSGVTQLFREALLKEQILEIQTPKLIAGASKGGSEVFRAN